MKALARPVETFSCTPQQGVRLTRSGCAKRHKSAAEAYGPGHLRKGKVWSEMCSSCSIGKAHLRGEAPTTWPDGRPIQFGTTIPAGALLRSSPARRKAEPLKRAIRLAQLLAGA